MAPKLPPDPFTPGSPLRAKVGNREIIVWSVGPNGIDDGGLDPVAADGTRRDDIAFVYPPSLRKKLEQQ